MITVVGGFGSGSYPVGTTMHLWADVPPDQRVMQGWRSDPATGDPGIAEPQEWHTTLVVPDHDTIVTATTVDAAGPPTMRTYLGPTTHPKRVFVFAPTGAPRGVLLLLHGTGGSASFGISGEAGAVARRAAADGWVVASPEAEEAVAGDLDGDGKERWDAAVAANNVDLKSLDGLVTSLRVDGQVPASAPNAVIGMSNGGGMAVALGSVSALAGSAFPALKFAAVVAHCSSGRTAQIAVTTTPTAFLACGNDDNDQVDNTNIEANSATLAGRGIRTVYRAHRASPLFAERFTRVGSIDVAASQAIYADLAPFLGPSGLFSVTWDGLLAEFTAHPERFPALGALGGRERNDVVDQIRATMATHQMYSDWAAYALAFIQGADRRRQN